MTRNPDTSEFSSDNISDYLTEGYLNYRGWKRALCDDVLVGQRCDECGHLTAAPKAACARCGSQSLVVTELPTNGEVYSETTISVTPENFDGPYQVALISLEDKQKHSGRVLAQIEGDVNISDSVSLVGIVESGDHPAPLFG